jgi:hypothetical protein
MEIEPYKTEQPVESKKRSREKSRNTLRLVERGTPYRKLMGYNKVSTKREGACSNKCLH